MNVWSKLSPPLSLSSLSFSLSLSLSLSSRAQEEREREAQLRGPPKLNRDEAATRIQKVQETKRNETICMYCTCTFVGMERIFTKEEDCRHEK